MKNFKSCTWGYGLIGSLVIGLSSCYMDGNNPQRVDYNYPQHHTAKAHTGAAKAQTVSKGTSSKEVVQKTTPGPKQTAAPQLPVIQ